MVTCRCETKSLVTKISPQTKVVKSKFKTIVTIITEKNNKTLAST